MPPRSIADLGIVLGLHATDRLIGLNISRICAAHGLIAKIPRTRRWSVTRYGHQVMATSLYLREHQLPNAYSRIAA